MPSLRRFTLLFAVFITLTSWSQLTAQSSFDSLIAPLETHQGFFDFHYDEGKGRILLEVPESKGDFIYVNSLAAGVGSNDIGLDRGQLGNTRLVHFRKTGNKLLLEQPNLSYRATSENSSEQTSVDEAFATSVLGGFKILASKDGVHLIDLTPMLIADAHGVGLRLEDQGQGVYKLDKNRSAIFMERSKSFPRNTEFEAIITLGGKAKGREIRSVTPTPDAVTTRQHHSFVALPDPGYKPRAFDARAGYFSRSFADYASAINEPLVKRLIVRHRLEKKNPGAVQSEAIAPIIYYVDAGAPEPVKSALIEGAQWWNEAFEAAGFKDAFQVRVLPEGADPLDVRYNVIQWVHRSTRGWSYGASVVDPRTGEIIKGHVSLGSLRVRQDFLIAQGLIEGYKNGQEDPRMLEFALARLRQLSAHEVGHTLGLAHNFAASTKDRASVMDYPHPYIFLNANGDVDLSKAYAAGIGTWDKQTIKYGYRVFSESDEDKGLEAILIENEALGIPFISDRDARPVGGAHPTAHLWDNGDDATAELTRIIALRQHALENLGPNNIAPGLPLGTLENVLAPVYLMHRYQVEATAKLIGGQHYTYSYDANAKIKEVSIADQKAAIEVLSSTLSPTFLQLPQSIHELLPPQPLGYARDRELFASKVGNVFDPFAAAEASIDHTLNYLLAPERITRLLQQKDAEVSQVLAKALLKNRGSQDATSTNLQGVVYARIFEHGMLLAVNESTSVSTRAWGLELAKQMPQTLMSLGGDHYQLLAKLLNTRLAQWQNEPSSYKRVSGARIPDGSPIGCGNH